MEQLLRGFRKSHFILVFGILCLGLFFQTTLAATEDSFYAPQAGTPAAIRNFVDMESGCNWSGIGGQVFDQQGEPATGLVVKVWGNLEGNETLFYAVTGGSLFFGPGGYLFKLVDHLAASSGTLRLQLLDITGAELSPPIQFYTYSDCSRNMIILNVRETIVQNPVYFPLIRK